MGTRRCAYKKGAKKDYNGDLPGEETPGDGPTRASPSSGTCQKIKADQAHASPTARATSSSASSTAASTPTTRTSKPTSTSTNSVNCADAGRPDLSQTGWRPTTSDHGTHVAGTIAAARNGVGIVGVAPNVRIASVKVVNDDGFIYPEYAVCGFVWAGLKHMDVTNNSYFVDPFMYYCEDQPDQYAAKEAVRRAVDWSTRQGVVHAAAAGNAATDLSNNTWTPLRRTTARRSPGPSTAVATTSPPSLTAWSLCRATTRRTTALASASRTEVLASSTSRPPAEGSVHRSRGHGSTGYGLLAARRWRLRTWPVCWH